MINKNDDLHKAAILLMSLPEEEAVMLLGQLSPHQVESVSIEIAKIRNVDGAEQETVIKDFAAINPGALGGESGGIELASRLLQQAMGGKANSTLDIVRQSIEAMPFAFLQKTDSQNLLTFLMDEHPQTIALVLSHLPAATAAEVLKGLTPESQLSVVRRVANMGQTSPEIIREVEQGLESRMASIVNQSFENAGGVESVAAILNVTERSTERALLENLAQDEPELVDEIRRRMFVFDDITKFQDKDVQSILKNVETSQWAMALKGASEDLKQKILGNMSKRAAETLQEEMDYLGPVRLSSVEQVQQKVVDIIRKLEDAGEITLHADETDEQFLQ
jgi:flagellar motor switch protein FliG